MNEERPLPPIRVIVASPDSAYAESLSRVLANRSMRVVRSSPKPGESVSDEELRHADVLLMEIDDVHTGEQLINRLRRVAPLVEVDAITGDPGVEDAVDALREGAFAVLPYPVSGELVVRTVEKASQRKRRAEDRIRQLNGDRRWSHASNKESKETCAS